MNRLVEQSDPLVSDLFRRIERLDRTLDELASPVRPVFNGQRFLSDKELSQRLRISRRCLQDYRNARRLPYYKLGGKVVYSEQDIQRHLEKNRFGSSDER